MKTAISIPDELFQAAEEAATRLSMSRSELYSTAIGEYLAAHVHTGVTEKLDEVYAREPSGLDKELERMQLLSLPREQW